MSKLSEKEIQKQLEKIPEWSYSENAIHTKYEFSNFKDCFSVMTRIAFECEALNHHPEWSNTYNLLSITLTTHDEGGVTLNDFKLALAIEGIIEEEE